MALQLASVSASAFTQCFLAACPECGAHPVAPLATGFVARGHIEHVWACDECNTAFATSVEFRAEDCPASRAPDRASPL